MYHSHIVLTSLLSLFCPDKDIHRCWAASLESYWFEKLSRLLMLGGEFYLQRKVESTVRFGTPFATNPGLFAPLFSTESELQHVVVVLCGRYAFCLIKDALIN